MFKLELSNNNLLKTAFNSISEIVKEVTLIFDNTGMHLTCLDQGHTVFITLDLNKDVFDEYACEKPEKIAIDCKEFMSILKKGKSKDRLLMTNDDYNLLMNFEGDGTKKFKIRMIDIEYDTPTPPEMNIPNSVTLPSALLNEYVTDLADFSNSIIFRLDGDYFKIINDGDFGEGEIEYLHGENMSESVQTNLSVEKLENTLRATKFSRNVTVHIGDDLPVLINYILPSDNGKLSYMIAPRIESDE